MTEFLEQYSYLFTYSNFRILLIVLSVLLGGVYCRYVTAETPFAAFAALGDAVKGIKLRHREDDTEDEDEIDDSTIDLDFSYTGGTGIGTVTEELAKNTEDLIENGKDIQDEFGKELEEELLKHM